MPVQHAALLMRMSASQLPSYLTRTLPPAVLQPALVRVKELRDSVLLHKMEIDTNGLSPAACEQLHLPLRLAGFGFTDHMISAHAAYAASLARALPRLRIPDGAPTQQIQDLEECIAEMRSTGIVFKPDELPDNFVAYFSNTEHSSYGLQRKLVSRINKKRYDDVYRDAEEKTKARLLCATAPGASRLFTCLPTSCVTKSRDEPYKTACRLRLGLPLHKFQTESCACREPLTPDHYLCCKLLTGRDGTIRHDALSNAQKEFCDFAGAVTKRTPMVNPLTKECPDLEVILPGQRPYYTDTTVIHPLAPTYVHGASRRRLHTASLKARSKHTHYDTHVERLGGKLFPLAFETLGGVHDENTGFIKAMVEEAVERNPLIKPQVLQNSFTESLAVTLAHHNWKMVRAGELKTQRALHERAVGAAAAAAERNAPSNAPRAAAERNAPGNAPRAGAPNTRRRSNSESAVPNRGREIIDGARSRRH